MQATIRGFTFILPCLEKKKRYDFKSQDGNDYAILSIDFSKESETITLFTKRGNVTESIRIFFSKTWYPMKHYSGKSFLSRSNSFSHGLRSFSDDADRTRTLHEEKVTQVQVEDIIDMYYRLLVV